MEQSEIEAAIIHAVEACVSKEGWVNLAELGTQLRRAGLHYGKLSSFLRKHEDLLEMKIDDTVIPPVVYARVKKKDG
ncbi:MAG: OST-HTH/LOTUS domain-containing protein [Bacteroidales bacterium]